MELETYEQAVEFLETVPLTSPGHFIVGGQHGNEGIVITRDIDQTDHRYLLSEDQWYVAITNVDVWSTADFRYKNAVKYLEELGQANVAPDGKSIIENVLWK